MRWYLTTLLFIAFMVGTLFKASEQTGMRIWNMFATMGIFLFGIVGSLALTRLQRGAGMKHVEAALKGLEPEWVITDWAGEGGAKPDYLLVGPDGIAAVCLDHTPGSAWGWRARPLIERSRQRAERSAEWVRSRLGQAPAGTEGPVVPVLLLTRRQAAPEYSAGGVTVINPDQLADHLRSGEVARLEQTVRFQLSRYFRTAT